MAENPPYWIDKGNLWSQLPGDEQPIWLSTAITVAGRTRNLKGEGYGLLLRWKDPYGHDREWIMPFEFLADDGKEMRRNLLDKGVRMSTGIKARRRMLAWLANQDPKHGFYTTETLGWNGYCYVLPDLILGAPEEPVVLVGWDREEDSVYCSGEQEDWIKFVGESCAGHRKLMMAVIVAFAGPLLKFCNEDTFGLHFYGGSSIGKTTALYVAQSVWGSPQGLYRWRATANALETVAASKNDGLLCLDEIAQLDPRQAAEVAYMLGNGKGKHRAIKDGSKAKEKTWRMIYLSTGEMSMANFVESNGGTMRGGMEVRQIDIPAEEGPNGILGWIGDMDAAEYIRFLTEGTRRYYGTVGRSWVDFIAKDPFEYVDFVEKQRSTFIHAVNKTQSLTNGQTRRVAEKFGFLFGVGRLACQNGLTGFSQSESDDAVLSQWNHWLRGRGGKKTYEEMKAIKQVREFIARHGDSRFQAARGSEVVVRDRAGYWRTMDEGGKEYLIHPEIWSRDICVGLNPIEVAKALDEKGYLRKGEGKNWSKKERIPNVSNACRMYVVKSSILEGADE
ncbi:MAG: DUF927 domain-containing protein [Magnetococcus sp. THC-1_WYH]